ncbi:MAG: putative toxin-antitoxin system toxin component, PIN family [Lachnospiraceae bacterium]|nr:putative toxin-antitoxin system toxin component, PIN family [Lachnospiraceae bacterium]
MQKFYAVIDTNVVISRLIKSANQDDTIIKLINKFIFDDEILIPVVNDDIIREYKEVTASNKFRKYFDIEVANEFINDIIEKAIVIDTPRDYKETLKENENVKHKDDLVFYYITLEAKDSIDKDTYLVTGNEKHFNFNLDFIVRPKEMINIIEDSLKKERIENEEEG